MAPRPDEDQINAQASQAYDAEDQGSKWPGMSYESGVAAALDWVLGNRETPPMEDD